MERCAFVEEMERRGELRCARTYVELALRIRLRCEELPAELKEIIGRETDQTTLARWLVEAAAVDTLELDQARALLGLPSP
jgi:hypothetical protein